MAKRQGEEKQVQVYSLGMSVVVRTGRNSLDQPHPMEAFTGLGETAQRGAKGWDKGVCGGRFRINFLHQRQRLAT